MTREQIEAWLQEHATPTAEDLAELVQSATPGVADIPAETLREFLESEGGRPIVQPLIDRRVTQAIETWRANNLEKLVQERLAEINPPKTEAEKRAAELEARLAQIEAERQRDKLETFATKLAVEKGLPVTLVSYFLGEDESSTEANLNVLASEFGAAVEAAVKARFEEVGGTPATGTAPKPKPKANPWKRETRNLTEQMRLQREDPELAAKLKAEAEAEA